MIRLMRLFCFVIGPSIMASASFDDALNKIVERNSNVLIQRKTIQSVNAKNLSSRFAWLPTLSLEAAEERNQQLNQNTHRSRSAEANLEVNLFRFGADSAAHSAAHLDGQKEELLLDQSILEAESDGAKALLHVIQRSLEMQTNRQFMELIRDSLTIARKRYERGLLALEEADKISVDVDNAQAILRDSEVNWLKAQASLKSLLGEEYKEATWPWRDRFIKGTPGAIQIGADSLLQRPDLQSQQAQIEASHSRMKEAWGKMLPSLDGKLSYEYINSSRDSTDGNRWSGEIRLSIPLFDRLVKYGEYQSRVHAEAIAELQFEKTKRAALATYESSKAAFRIALEEAKARDATLITSRRLYQANRKRFQQGLIDANDLLLDETRLYNAEINGVRSWSGVHTSFADFCHALGRRLSICN